MYVSQVVTEPALVNQSQRLHQLLASGQLREICHSKSDPVWTFVAASLEPDYRLAMRTLLGFTQDQLEVSSNDILYQVTMTSDWLFNQEQLPQFV